MGDALVALNTTHLIFHRRLHSVAGIFTLFVEIHRLEGMAVFTGLGIIGFEFRPDRFGQFQALGFEFLSRIHVAKSPMIELVHGIDFAVHAAEPGFRKMAIGAFHPHPGSIGIVNGLLVFLIDVLFHLVARDAVFQAFGFIKQLMAAAQKGHSSQAAGNKDTN